LYKNMRSFCRKYSILASDQLKFSSFSLARSRTRAQTLNMGDKQPQVKRCQAIYVD